MRYLKRNILLFLSSVYICTQIYNFQNLLLITNINLLKQISRRIKEPIEILEEYKDLINQLDSDRVNKKIEAVEEIGRKILDERDERVIKALALKLVNKLSDTWLVRSAALNVLENIFEILDDASFLKIAISKIPIPNFLAMWMEYMEVSLRLYAKEIFALTILIENLDEENLKQFLLGLLEELPKLEGEKEYYLEKWRELNIIDKLPHWEGDAFVYSSATFSLFFNYLGMEAQNQLVSILKEKLSHPQSRVRFTAVNLIERIFQSLKDKSIQENLAFELLDMLQDEDASVRWLTIFSLEQIVSPSSGLKASDIEKLTRVLLNELPKICSSDSDEKVRTKARELLTRLSEE